MIRRIIRDTLALWLALTAGLATGFPTSARAENVDLSTVPDRDTVQLTIYNLEDLTLAVVTSASELPVSFYCHFT